ncbi:MAG: ELWxxDGT repeat protein [Bacteroidota bacterium]
MYKYSTLLLGAICFFFASKSAAQNRLLTNVNPGIGWANYEPIFEIGEQIYFLGTSGSGREIWRTDGTSMGTEELIDLNPGFPSSEAQHFTPYGNRWFFSATEGLTGIELWITDGTASGTVQVRDIHPSASSDPSNLVVWNGLLYFTANDGENGFELWKSDGTEAGTERVSNINPGAGSASPQGLTLFNGRLYFQANDGQSGPELWTSDGTAMGTSQVADLFPDSTGSFPANFTVVNEVLYFTADDGTNGQELWASDGSSNGTTIVQDINPGIGGSNPADFNALGNRLYFTATDADHGLEVWSVTGTINNLQATLYDLVPGPDDSDPVNFHIANDNSLYFSAKGPTEGFEPWRSVASTGETYLVRDINQGFDSSSPFFLGNLGNQVVFRANNGLSGEELWISDGTREATQLLADINPNSNPASSSSTPSFPLLIDNQLYFTAFSDKGWHIWRTDGTREGTQMRVFVEQDTIFNNFYIPSAVNQIGETLLFLDYAPSSGVELWTSRFNPLFVQESSTSPNCQGDSTGSIELLVLGGLGPADSITYEWDSPLASGSNPTGLPADIYRFTITDCGGYQLTGSYFVAPADSLKVNFETVEMIACIGESGGAVEAFGSGGMEPYRYQWNTGDTTKSISNLSAGIVTVTIVDANGCEQVEAFEVTEPTTLEVEASILRPISCPGETDGQIVVENSGGTPLYTWLWSNGASTQPAQVGAGSYTVTTTDANGCTAVDSLTITDPMGITNTFTIDQNVSCTGGMDGQVTALASGSSPGYTYVWADGNQSATNEGLAAGFHLLTITDAQGCELVDSVVIEEPEALELTIIRVNAPSCLGAADGTATVQASGGTGPYNYSWVSGATDSVATNLTVGLQQINIIDANGCELVDNIAVPGTAVQLSSTGTSCNGVIDGAAMVMINDPGMSSYSYNWSTGDTSASILQLPAGTYIVTITDAINCTVVDSVAVEEPPAIVINSAFSAPPICPGEANGSLTVMAEGGTQPYTYSWSTGETTATGFLPGLIGDSTYCVSFVDANGCPGLDSCFVVVNPTPISADFTEVFDASCAGDTFCNGTATVQVVGGTAGTGIYNFSWSNGEEDEGPNGQALELCAGWNTVIVDDGICSITDSVLIGSPPPLMLVVESEATTGSDGTVSAMGSGGQPGYSYSWNTVPVQTDSMLTGLLPGTYVVTLTDANGCTLVDSVLVDLIESLEAIEGLEQLSLSPNPSPGELRLRATFDRPTLATMRIFDGLGRLIYESAALRGREHRFELDFAGKASGLYFIQLDTDRGSLLRPWVLE